MNRPDPTYPGGPGQRAAQAERDKARRDREKRNGEGRERAGSRNSKKSQLRTAAAALSGVEPPGAGAKRARKTSPPKSQRRWGASDGGGERPREEGDRAGAGLRILKNVVGLCLLPVAWVWTVSFGQVLGDTTLRNRFWLTEDFWFFSLGFLFWLVAFSGCLYWRGTPPFLKTYVRFHEWTHAIWTWLSRGEVGEIQIHEDHGHVLTNKPTVLVTLSPYFYPVPCVILVTLYLPLHLCLHPESITLFTFKGVSLSGVSPFVLLMGMGWGFHFTYTVWMIRKGQSDLRMHGNLFSLVVIYLVNLAVLTLFMVLTAPNVDVWRFCTVLGQNGLSLAESCSSFIERTWRVALEK